MFYRVLILFFLFSHVLSQTNYDDYNESVNCFETGDYVCSKVGFDNFLNKNPYATGAAYENAQFYLFLSTLRLYHKDTERLFDQFVRLYPLSNRIDDAHFYMGEYFFRSKKYSKVVNILAPINIYQIDNKHHALFYLGYSAYKENKYELAKSCFFELINSFDSTFKDDAIYYNSCMLVDEALLDEALLGFSMLESSSKYVDKIPYYIATIMFYQAKFKEIDYYLDVILNNKMIHKYDELVLLYAKSLYNLKNYDKSIVYFEESKSLNDTLTNLDLYQIGTAYHAKGLYGFAVNHLNKITTHNDSITQYALYYLADSYIHTNNRHEAMNAFRSASLLDYDTIMQHDAFYRFALLAYEQNSPLYDAKVSLQDFVDKFPHSIHLDEVYTCLANLYLNTSDYNQAILVLEQSDLENVSLKSQYQKITFHRGVQLYNDGNFLDAINYFNKSIKIYNNSNLLNQSYYWLGESYYNLNMFNHSLESYKSVLQGDFYNKSLYSQGYCYMKLDDYYNAIKQFKYISNNETDITLLHDIYVRIGDGYFKLMNYQFAVDFYNKAIELNGFQGDYAVYKKSTSLVLLEDYNLAIESFNDLINNFNPSNYIDDAIYDLGNVHILAKNYNLAISTFRILIEEFPNSVFYSSSHVKIGLVYYMQQKDFDAIDVFKKIVLQFPSTNVAQEALNMIKNIYSENGDVSMFLDFISTLEHDYTKSELDSSMYYSAELQYMQSSYQNAINGFNSYLDYYPNGLFYIESNYFLSKSYQNIGDFKNAIQILNSVVNEKENKYTVDALLELSRMSFKIENYISAEGYFRGLINMSPTLDIKKEAIMGLLESKFNLYKYSDLSAYITDSVKYESFSGKDFNRLKYLQAYSLFKMDKQSEALSKFNWLILNSEGALRAESSYYVSLIYYYKEDYDNCEEMVFKLIKEFPNYNIWVDKSLLILAKNYIAQEDFFQAEHVLGQLFKSCNDPLIIEEIINLKMAYFPESKIDSLIK